MLGKLTQDTLAMVPKLGTLTRETLEMVERFGKEQGQAIEVEYNGFLIHPTPKPLRDVPAWTLEVQIARDVQGEHHVMQFGTKNTLPTRDEAIGHAILFAQRIIDGQVPGCSVTDL